MAGNYSARSKNSKEWARGIGVVALMGLFCLAPLAVEAQSAAKRSGDFGNPRPNEHAPTCDPDAPFLILAAT